MKGLRKNERCPIHGGSLVCCGRSERKRISAKYGSGPVRKIPDPTQPEGYREVCSPAEKRRRKIILIRQQDGKCALCGKPFTNFDEAELDHKEPCGLGGATRNDIMRNLRVIHWSGNRDKGSQRIVDGVEPGQCA